MSNIKNQLNSINNFIKDDFIKLLIKNYKDDNNQANILAILKYLSKIIYNYPKHKKNINLYGVDIEGEFYLYISEQIKNIIDSYELSDTPFIYWFLIVLRTRFVNFFKKTIAQHKNIKIYEEIFQQELIQGESILYQRSHILNYMNNSSIYQSNYQDYQYIIKKIELLPKKIKLIIKLYIDPCSINSDTLQDLSNTFKVPITHITSKYRDLFKNYISKKNTSAKCFNKISKLYTNLYKNQMLYRNIKNDSLSNNKERDDMLIKINNIKVKLHRLINKFYNHQINFDISSLSQFLDKNPKYISSLLQRSRMMLRVLINDKNYLTKYKSSKKY